MTYLLIFKSKRYNVGKNQCRKLLQEFDCKMIQFPVINKHKVIKFNSDKELKEIESYMIENCEYVDKIISYEI